MAGREYGSRTLAISLTVAAVLLAVGAPPSGADHETDHHDVEMVVGNDFSPMAMTIDPGDTVTWTHSDAINPPHNIVQTGGPATLEGWGSPSQMYQDDTYSFTFSSAPAGTYSYECSWHASDGMTGTITVTNAAPVANDAAHTTAKETPVSDALPVSDANGDPLTITADSGPSDGTVTYDGTTFTYTPRTGFVGTDQFTYTATDEGGLSDSGTIAIDVTGTDEVPVADDDAVTTDEDTAFSDVLAGTDPEGEPVVFAIGTGPILGTVVLDDAGTGTYTYTPDANAHGTDSFTYTLHEADDPSKVSNEATITVTVNPVNDPPAVTDPGVLTTEKNTPGTATIDATDVDGDTLTYSVTTDPAHGTVTLDGATATYTPDTDFTGEDAFTVTVDDGQGETADATVPVQVLAPGENAPIAEDAQHTLEEDTPLSGNLVATDDDPEDTLTFEVVEGPDHGVLDLTGGGTFTYTPDLDFHGDDQFTFRANDGSLDSNTATVSFTVTPVNDAPRPADDPLETTEGVPIEGTFVAPDPEGDDVTFAIVHATGGDVTLLDETTGAFRYAPERYAEGDHTITYTATDVHDTSATGTVAVTVLGIEDPPRADDSSPQTPEDTPLEDYLRGSDPDLDDTLTYAIVTDPAHGEVDLVATGEYTYTPDADFHGVDGFEYRVTDAAGLTALGNVTVTVTPVNDAPVAHDLAFTAESGRDLAATADATDVDGDALTFALGTPPERGTATVAENGTVTYASVAGYVGADTFTVVASDGVEDDTLVVNVTVIPRNERPHVDFTYSPARPRAGDIVTFRADASDADGAIVAWRWAFGVGPDATGANTSAVFPTAGSYGVTLTVTDDRGANASRTLAVDVAPGDDDAVDGTPAATVPLPGLLAVGAAVVAALRRRP